MSCFLTKRHTNLTQTICQLQLLGDPYVFTSDVKFGEVMMFACEVECNDTVAAQQQLTLYLCLAQYQRRALSFGDGQEFGATVVKNTLTMYCSKWENKKVVRILSRSSLCSL